MAKKTPKPETPYAKAHAALCRDSRRVYPGFDFDVARFGEPTAHFNAGFLAGYEKAERKFRRQKK